MDVYSEFFLKFMKPFFEGIATIFKNLGLGLFQMFNVLNYVDVIKEYSSSMTGGGVFVIVLSILCLLVIYGVLIFLIVLGIRRIVRYRKNIAKQEAMVDEIDRLNADIVRLKAENEKFLTMSDGETGNVEYDKDGKVVNKLEEGESRFFKLTKIDEAFVNYEKPQYNKSFTLEQFCDQFRNYAASELKLYYPSEIIRLFIASFASNRLIILQGISGTGKTSLAYAFGKMVQNEATIASVQPSWRDSSELFGYFNEFTKRFNETEVLAKMYEASYTDDVYITVLDEMNISRVEYYFAQMLSILELPSRSQWIIPLVPSAWDNDPKLIKDGEFHIPGNMWYIGTINNDDSTFMITDKVYDRAMPIEIDDKCDPFDAPKTESMKLSSSYLEELFTKAQKEHAVSKEVLDKIGEMDRYVIDHFRLAFGNRIVKQLNEFVPAYVACGGKEIAGVDYLIAHKILRKFEQLNLSYIKNEIDGFIDYLEELFGKGNMPECVNYLRRLKKTI
jgi:hypothetical protein